MKKKVWLSITVIVLLSIVLYWQFGGVSINGVRITKDTRWYHIIDDRTDASNRDEIRSKAEYLLVLSQFDELEAMANKYRTSRQQFKNGEFELNSFYAGLSHYLLQKPGVQENWEVRLDKLRAWVASRPNSATARIALSECLVGYAFAGRGYGYAKTVSDEGEQLFNTRVQEAERLLMERPDLPDQCPQGRAALMRLHGPEWTGEKFLQVFTDAVERDPQFSLYYYRTAIVLLPRWYGGEGDIEKFSTVVADRIGGVQGDILYARIIWYLDYNLGLSFLNKKNPRIDWRRVKRGLESI